MNQQRYCLDANVLIQAWQNYYAPEVCPDYWEILKGLGEQKRLFLPEEVYQELEKTQDDLLKWVKKSHLPIEKTNTQIIQCLTRMYAANPLHKFLVDNKKNRSQADPWVIAHAMHFDACVVTKENKVMELNAKTVKIPNVCENMKVEWMNDFGMVRALNIRFTCSITP